MLLPLLVFLAGFSSAPATGTSSPPFGALRVDMDTDIDYVDPALAYYVPTWQIEQATCAKLLNYPDSGSGVLEPEIAAAMPTVSPDGRTYTFQIRSGFAFSPPATGSVTAQSMKYTFERLLNRFMASPAQYFFEDIVGARKYSRGEAASVSGIVASGNTLSFELVRPASDFVSRMAMPFGCAVPTSLPINPDGVPAPVPSAGPYYISAWDPHESITITPNPNYTGPRPRRWSSIDYTIGFP